MIINATEFKMRAGKYLKLAEKQEIIITKNGKQVAKLVPINKQGTPNADFLYGLMRNFSNKDISLRRIRKERIGKYESSN
ncbi:MAG: type II toxin-antitoxin system prevent-host-death family antitoxin [Clostridia bacterium]|nr:type II toxin-antitoxin system prevent-host-death family antitoxin [Clostridia bacterium]